MEYAVKVASDNLTWILFFAIAINKEFTVIHVLY